MRPINYLWTFAHTLRYLKWRQVVGRVVARVKRELRFSKPPAPPADLKRKLEPNVPFLFHDPWNDAESIRCGQFTFLNRCENLGVPVDWHPTRTPLLWQFNLHYFNYLHLLDMEEQVVLCRSWIERNPIHTGIGWHPYPTSLRITNWCRASFSDIGVLKSLYQQAGFLYRNLETYVYGNHVLENARALVLAGCLFGDVGEAPRWREKGLQIMLREQEEQVLPDGGHYERSPMYHALMLEAFLDVINALPPCDASRIDLIGTVRAMSDALISLTHPDGMLALFKDSTREIAPSVGDLVHYVRDVIGYKPKKRSSLPEMGYYIYQDSDISLIIDGGKAGPRHLMAHAHADQLSYELAIQGVQIIVDTGVFEYQSGEMRDLVRRTQAHNTVCIDEKSQMECWGSFRVARRYPACVNSFELQEGGCVFVGTYPGYSKLIGDDLRHVRRVSVRTSQGNIHIIDEVTGRGKHLVESRVHFHPDVEISNEEDLIRIRRQDVTCTLIPETSEIRWEEGWYCPRFGERIRNRVLVLGGMHLLPLSLSYRIRYR